MLVLQFRCNHGVKIELDIILVIIDQWWKSLQVWMKRL